MKRKVIAALLLIAFSFLGGFAISLTIKEGSRIKRWAKEFPELPFRLLV